MNRYEASEEPELVTLDTVTGLSVTGQGEPGGTAYTTSVQALYAVAAAMNVPMPPLEGRWWVEDDRPPLDVPRTEWWWHLFLPAPTEGLDEARDKVRAGTPAACRVQAVTVHEGRCVQILHVGSFADEPRSLAAMDAYMEKENLTRRGLHHEIYLDPDTPRTVLRQPVR